METMEYIWERVASADSRGEKCIVYKNEEDLAYLYSRDFVDASRFSLEEWISAFNDSKQKDGSFRLSYSQWMAKKTYRPGFETVKTDGDGLFTSYERLRTMTASTKTDCSAETLPPTLTGTVSLRQAESLRKIRQMARI